MVNAVKHSGKIKTSKDNKIFDAVVTILLILTGLVAIYPLWFVAIASISDATKVAAGDVLFWPRGISFEGYSRVFKDQWILVGFRNSILYTLIGTFLNVMATVMVAYPLARKDLYGKKVFNWIIAIPMWFGGGLIPTYLVVKQLGLLNTPYVLLILGLVSCYNVIICRTFISSLPYELQEAAKLDGCSDFQILWRVIMPLSKPIMAVLALYYAVSHWNDYFNAMIYINNKNYQTLQIFLREVLLINQSISYENAENFESIARQMQAAQQMKYSLIIVAAVPMLLVYPFVQKYFVKGVMVGSVKG